MIASGIRVGRLGTEAYAAPRLGEIKCRDPRRDTTRDERDVRPFESVNLNGVAGTVRRVYFGPAYA
jgi:hypothetical protein